MKNPVMRNTVWIIEDDAHYQEIALRVIKGSNLLSWSVVVWDGGSRLSRRVTVESPPEELVLAKGLLPPELTTGGWFPDVVVMDLNLDKAKKKGANRTGWTCLEAILGQRPRRDPAQWPFVIIWSHYLGTMPLPVQLAKHVSTQPLLAQVAQPCCDRLLRASPKSCNKLLDLIRDSYNRWRAEGVYK